MIPYLIKSAVCLAVLLAAYNLFFEREKMHRFSRFYLLAALIIGLTMPLLSVSIKWGTVRVPASSNAPTLITEPSVASRPSQMIEFHASYTPGDYLLIGWLAVTAIILVRFTINVARLNQLIKSHEHVDLGDATLVLIPTGGIPNSFLNYIFVDKGEYRGGRIEQEMLAHEAVHVSQKHSLDILFIELLKVLFWFNPLFILYKQRSSLTMSFWRMRA